MKIAFITTFYDEKGGAEYIAKYIENTSKQWSANKVFSIMPSDEVMSFSKSHPINFLETLQDLILEVKKYNPDKIYLHLGHSVVIIIASIFTALGYETLLHIQDPWFSFKELKSKIDQYLDKDFLELRNSNELPDFFKSFNKLSPIENLITSDLNSETLNKASKRFIVSSEDMKQFLISEYNLLEDRVTVLPLFLTDEFRSRSKPELSTLKFKEDNTLVYIGRIKDSWKNFPQLLRNIQKTNWNLTIFTRDNNAKDFVEMLINKLIKEENRESLLKRVRVISNLNNEALEQKLKKFTYIVVPSIVEGFSLTILENLYRGKIILNSSIMGGPVDLIQDNVNGFKFLPNNIESFNKALGGIEKLNEKELNSISVNARKSAEEYTEANFNKNLKKIILS